METNYKQKLETIESLKQKIRDEEEMIEDYDSQINDLEDEIDDYENETSEEDFDLHFVNDRRDEIDTLSNQIRRAEYEIKLAEEQIDEMLFGVKPNVTINKLIQKWETKLNEYHNNLESIRDDYKDGGYESESDYQGDFQKVIGKIAVTQHFIDDLKSMMETEGDNIPKFQSIKDAYDWYWDLSRNPYDMYETEQSLIEGERSFVERCGYDWEQWCDINK